MLIDDIVDLLSRDGGGTLNDALLKTKILLHRTHPVNTAGAADAVRA